MTKVFARSPFRLGLAGGGTDVVPYCYEMEGAVLNVAISKYCYVTVTTSDFTQFRSRDLDCVERYNPKQEGALVLHFGVHRYFERLIGKPIVVDVETYSEVPAGSGLGSSSSIIVVLVTAYACFLNIALTKIDIANVSILIERKELNLSGGLQDQYAAAFGGINLLQFTNAEEDIVNRVSVSDRFLSFIESSLILVNSGASRQSAGIIDKQKKLAKFRDQNFLKQLIKLKAGAYSLQAALLQEDFEKYIEVMRHSWIAKKNSTTQIADELIKKIELDVVSAGGLAFKVSGAGGGGYCQIYASPDDRFMVMTKLQELGYSVETPSFQTTGAQAWNIS